MWSIVVEPVLILDILDQTHQARQWGQDWKDPEISFDQGCFPDVVHIKEFTVNFGPPLLHRINQLMAVGRILGHG